MNSHLCVSVSSYITKTYVNTERGRQPFAEGFSPTVALPIGNSKSDSIGSFMFLTGLETDCRRETGASRYRRISYLVKVFWRNIAYLLIPHLGKVSNKTINIIPLTV
ncbi:MAG: hypothetical protein LBG58_00490 [Planctomycetaceae bacterium]|nr:hypothetical protein [Planctomycetaceae bacterium]